MVKMKTKVRFHVLQVIKLKVGCDRYGLGIIHRGANVQCFWAAWISQVAPTDEFTGLNLENFMRLFCACL